MNDRGTLPFIKTKYENTILEIRWIPFPAMPGSLGSGREHNAKNLKTL
jgi:hypothetical protein